MFKEVKDFVAAHIPLVEKVVKNTERIGLKGNLLNSGSQSNHISKIKGYTLYTAKSVPSLRVSEHKAPAHNVLQLVLVQPFEPCRPISLRSSPRTAYHFAPLVIVGKCVGMHAPPAVTQAVLKTGDIHLLFGVFLENVGDDADELLFGSLCHDVSFFLYRSKICAKVRWYIKRAAWCSLKKVRAEAGKWAGNVMCPDAAVCSLSNNISK
jgi:hypothetical protein